MALLKDGQDPESLEASVAYHLRRLRVPWQTMLAAGIGGRTDLADLTQGRLLLNAKVVQELAVRLAIEPGELLRPLTAAEAQGWLS